MMKITKTNSEPHGLDVYFTKYHEFLVLYCIHIYLITNIYVYTILCIPHQHED